MTARHSNYVKDQDQTSRHLLLDVSRLIWRSWRGGLPTGIDRVCLAYLEHFGTRAQAVVQRDGLHFVLSPRHSDRLFSFLMSEDRISRPALAALLAGSLLGARTRPPRRGMVYLNVGHTGLHERTLPLWIKRNGIKAIYLIHDLIPITNPEYCRPGEDAKHRLRMDNALSSAAGIIGNSQVSIDDLASYATVTDQAMPPTLAAWISGPSMRVARSPVAEGHPYFVALGTIEGRKNHRLLLDAWDKIVRGDGRQAPDLVIVGQRGWQAEDVFEILDRPERFAGHVRERNVCGDEELESLLAGARALLMPSFAEGFGLPVVEALQSGTPVIASDLPVFREIAGDIPLYIDATETNEWVAAIMSMVQADSAEALRQRRSMESFQAPRWEDHFAAVEDWLQEIEGAPKV